MKKPKLSKNQEAKKSKSTKHNLLQSQYNSFLYFFFVTLANWFSGEKDRVIEFQKAIIKVKDEQLAQCGKRIRYTNEQRALLARKSRNISWSMLRELSFLTPETLFRWYNRLIALKYTSMPNPTKAKETRERVVALVVRIAKENLNWGSGKIVGALKHLGIKRSKSTVSRIMINNGFDPQPDGGKSKTSTWKQFWDSHMHFMVGADFLMKEVLTWRGLVRYLIFFVIDYKTRKVEVVQISDEFYGAKMEQLARQMAYFDDGIMKDKNIFVCDKDPLYTKKFKQIFKWANKTVKQVSSPIHNPYAERFVKTIKTECLDHLIIFGEKMLFRAVEEFVEYYNTERPHQSLDNEFPCPDENKYRHHLELTKKQDTLESLYKSKNPERLIVKKTRLGGLANFYYKNCG